MTARLVLLATLAACGQPAHVDRGPDAPIAVSTDASLPPDASADAATAGQGRRMYLLMTSGGPGAEIENVELDPSPHLLATIDLHRVAPTALAVSADGSRAYLAITDAVEIVDLATGAVVATTPVPGASDVAAYGNRLWVACTAGIAELDASTSLVLATYPAPQINSIAVSGDGALVGGAASSNAVVLDTAAGTVTSVGLQTSGTSNCGIEAMGAAFGAGPELLIWDPNCDELYRVDGVQHRQTATLVFGRDQGTRYSRDYLRYSPLTNKAYAWHESDQVAIGDLGSGRTTNIATGSPGTLISEGMTPDGRLLVVGVEHDANELETIAVLDTQAETFHDGWFTVANGSLAIADIATAGN